MVYHRFTTNLGSFVICIIISIMQKLERRINASFLVGFIVLGLCGEVCGLMCAYFLL